MKRSSISFFALVALLSSVIALQAQDVVISDISSTPTTCAGGSDGTITVSVSGGVGNYSYLMVKGAMPVEFAGPIASNTFTFTGHEEYPTYQIIVSDEDDNTVNVNYYFGIGGPDPIVITSTLVSDITCNGANNGSIQVMASGEDGNYIFELTGPVNLTNTTGIFTGLPQGDYTVEVSHDGPCPISAVSQVLSIANPSSVSISVDVITDVACFGNNTGSIAITPGGGTPGGGGSGYTYFWNGPNGFTSTTEDIFSLEAGDYFVTVYDGNMCTANVGPINISQPTELTAALTGASDVSCFGGNDGTATITPGGGTGAYSYSWDGQANGLISTDQSPVNLLADTYDFTLFDAGGCSKTFLDFVTIFEPAPIDANVIAIFDVSCPGGSDGSAEITPTGGTGPYSCAWVGVTTGYTSNDKDPQGMPADEFNLIITDANGCPQAFPGIINISEPAPIAALVNSTSEVSCFGGTDGAADITVNGGTPLYTIFWSGIGSGHTSSGNNPNNLMADTYNVSITDGNGCPQLLNGIVTIDEPADISVSVDNVIAVDCNEAATGAIEITPTGGTPGYSFSWTGPNGFTATSEDIYNLEAGDYNLIITDANGCNRDFISLAIVATNTSITGSFVESDITCNGVPNGAISANISGGTPAYIFDWTGPSGFTSSDEDISGLIPGTYQLTVTDNLGCIEVMPVQILTEPEPISASTTQIDIDCFGAANGSVNLTSAGGVAPHLYTWTGPGGFTAATKDLSNLEPGTYSLDITDANSCIVPFPDIVTILEPAEILTLSVKTDISCGGLSDGAINIDVAGGVLPYTFAWTGPGGFVSSSKDISGLAAGSYDLVITDGNGCIMNFPGIETIIEPISINAILISQSDLNCKGDANGSIEIDVSGGTAPLLFDWTNGAGVTVSTDEDPTGLMADAYSLMITDGNGCSISYPNMLSLTEPPALVSSLSMSQIACYGEGDGTITVNAVGGVTPYEYSRNGDLDPSYQSDNDFTGLGPGFYTIWTRDANRCTVSDTITIIEPEEIQVIKEIKWGQNFCYGDSSGFIFIEEVTGGVQPYVYSINDGVDFYPTKQFNNLPAGDYQTVIRDATGCEASGNLNVITQPSKLVIDSYIQEDVSSCSDAPEGRIIISGAGGFGTKVYLLDGSINSLTGDFQNLAAGFHTLRIGDQNGCTLDTIVEILAPDEIVVDILNLMDVTGCSGFATGAVTAEGSGGSGSITYSLDGIVFQGSGTFSGLLAGNHTLTLKDDNDCTLDTVFTLSEPGPMTIDSELVSPITCAGAANGIIEIMVSGGTSPLSYTLNPGGTNNANGNFTGVAPGSYTVSVNDAEGCGPVNSSLLILADPPVLILDSLSNKDISCNGASDGEIIIYLSGGIPPYEYSVDNQLSWISDSLFADLGPGTYEVFGRDANLCSVNGGSIILTDPALLTISVTGTHITGCAGDTTGAIDISSAGGTGIHLYSLDGIEFQASGSFINLPGGDYITHVQDETGCSVTQPFTIIEPEKVVATIVKTDATFGNLGSINITETTGGIPPYQYTIEGPDGTFSTKTLYGDLDVGSYHVITMDATGCIDEDTVNILDVLPLDVEVNVTDVSCFGEVDGIIEMHPLDAEGAVEYSIDSGLTFHPEALFEDLAGNVTYNLVARDAAEKVFTRMVTIIEPTEISFSSSVTPAECNAFSETGEIDITVWGGTPGYTYFWSDGSSEEDRSDILAGTYTLQTTDTNSCTRIDVIIVNSLDTVYADAGKDTTICYGTSIQLNGQGGNTPSWSPLTFLSGPDIANPMAQEVTENTTYVLTIKDEASSFGCFNVDSLSIEIFPLIGLEVTEDTFVVRGRSVELEAVGGPFSTYRWEPPTGLDNTISPNPIAAPQQSIQYWVYAMNEYGCEESDSVFVEVIEDIRAYNVFSPNGDGINDFFDIESADRFPEIVVEVYSRWGDMLFSTKGYDDGSRWDGTTRGKDAPLGTYYYVIIPYSGAKPITGNVTIIR